MKQYAEGWWFAVPLRDHGFGLGLVTRAARGCPIIVAHFFAVRVESLQEIPDLEHLRPRDTLQVMRAGDLGLIDGTWPLLGRVDPWIRSDWPTPPFAGRDELGELSWIVRYRDDDPSTILTRHRVTPEETKGLPRDMLYGAGAVERVLTERLRNVNQA